MIFKNKNNKSYNVGDGKIIWESRSVSVNTVIIAKSKGKKYVLISKRGEGAADYKGYWNVQAGYIDWNETCTDAAKREVFEETNINIDKILKSCKIYDNHIDKFLYVNSAPDSNRQNITFNYGLYFKFNELPLLDICNKNAELNEVDEIKWVSMKEVGNYQFAFYHNEDIHSYNEKYCTPWYNKMFKNIWKFISS